MGIENDGGQDDQGTQDPNATGADGQGAGNDQGNQGQGQGGEGAQGGAADGNQGNQGDQTPQVPEWLSDVEDESLRSEDALKTLSRFKGKGDLAKSYLELRGKVGENPITVPGENATDEEREAFYKAIGRPDSPDKYEFPEIEGVEPDDDATKAFKEAAHKLGVPPEMASGMYQYLMEQAKTYQENQAKAIETTQAETEKTLKKEFGKDYETNLTAGDNALRQVIGDEAMKKLEAAGLHVDADVVRGAVKLSQAIGEDKLRGMGDGSRGGQVKTRAELEDIMKKNPDWKSDPKLKQEVEDGFRALYPENNVAAYTDPSEAQAH
jgi:hypothetical protein